MANYGDSSTYSTASGKDGLQYVVLQVTLKEKFLGGDRIQATMVFEKI